MWCGELIGLGQALGIERNLHANALMDEAGDIKWLAS
jgi:hypothetical protein